MNERMAAMNELLFGIGGGGDKSKVNERARAAAVAVAVKRITSTKIGSPATFPPSKRLIQSTHT